MAPKKGGGGSHSSGSSGGSSISIDSCPGAFQGIYTRYDVVDFVDACLFFVLTLLVLCGMCAVRKRHSNAKRLIKPFYSLALLCMLTGYAQWIIGSVLRECGTTPVYSFNDWVLAFNIFWRLGTYFLLIVVVYGINNLLRERLGSGQSFVKIFCIADLAIMGALTAGFIGFQSYEIWLDTPAGQDSDGVSKTHQLYQLIVAYWILYLLSVVGAGGLALASIFQLRSRSIPVGSILLWSIVVYVCMFAWALMETIVYGSVLENHRLSNADSYIALDYLENFFQTFSFIAVLALAKCPDWDTPAVNNVNTDTYGPQIYPAQPVQYASAPPPMQQYAYTGQPGQQQYYVQQQPVYNGTPSPVNGQGHVVNVK